MEKKKEPPEEKEPLIDIRELPWWFWIGPALFIGGILLIIFGSPIKIELVGAISSIGGLFWGMLGVALFFADRRVNRLTRKVDDGFKRMDNGFKRMDSSFQRMDKRFDLLASQHGEIIKLLKTLPKEIAKAIHT